MIETYCSFAFSYLKNARRQYVLLGLLLMGNAHAIDPVPGIYAGATLGVSYAPNITYTFTNPLSLTTGDAVITHSILGNVGVQLGYRFLRHFRVEGQLFVNDNPYKSIKVNNTVTITGGLSNLYRIKGQTITTALFANAFYDFLSTADGCNIAPYVGGGIGYGYIKNSLKLYYNNAPISSTVSSTGNTPIAQGIIGLGYFMDSFTIVGLDLRLMEGRDIAPIQSNPKIFTVNLTLNGMFDCG
jgi:hypothetical protein